MKTIKRIYVKMPKQMKKGIDVFYQARKKCGCGTKIKEDDLRGILCEPLTFWSSKPGFMQITVYCNICYLKIINAIYGKTNDHLY